MTRRTFIGALASTTYGKSPVEELILDAGTGRVVRSDFPVGHREPVGSLVKVFTALAYGARNRYEYPVAICHGTESGCWHAPGHGRLTLSGAIAHSCNSYFLKLASEVAQIDVAVVAQAYGVTPPTNDSPEARIGLGRGWLEAPEAIAKAYVTLASRRQEPGPGAIVEGLRQAARGGTAKACGAGVLAKTGTSACVHRPTMPGDGWALGLFPDDVPRYAVLVREHGAPGAVAAVHLASTIAALRSGRSI